MPGQLKATAEHMEQLARFLRKLTSATIRTGVEINERFSVELPDGAGSIDVRWHSDLPGYVIDDQVGR